MKKKYFFGFFFLLPFSLHGEQSLDPQKIIDEVKKRGAINVVDVMNFGPGKTDFEKVLENIYSGEEKWLEVAQYLKPGTDASTSEGLDTALAKALKNNPKGVLNAILLQKKFSVDDICSCPFYEGDPIDVDQYIKETVGNLKKINESRLQKIKKQCIHKLLDP